MKMHDAFPGNFLKKEDFPQPTLATIDRVEEQQIKGDKGEESKPVLYLRDPSDRQLDTARGLIVNKSNWEAIEHITGADDSDEWAGQAIVLFNDPTVMFGAKRVGGVRIRSPKSTAAVPTPPPAAEEPPPHEDGDIPF